MKWGYADEFIGLYKKNHYPLLKKALEKGDGIVGILPGPGETKKEEQYRFELLVAHWDLEVQSVDLEK